LRFGFRRKSVMNTTPWSVDNRVGEATWRPKMGHFPGRGDTPYPKIRSLQINSLVDRIQTAIVNRD
ncbi:MAG TPA: hypothetical protein VJM15_08620, partial [Sphingomicrobium sp.]|nr:hypothetical protein [Sphingomicrobium sp.]